MPRFIALLHGVNVGRAQRVPMAVWREQLSGLGYTGVSTVLNSGNAVFDAAGRATAASHASRIRAALRDGLGLDVPVIVKSAAEMTAIAAQNTLAAEVLAPADASRLIVAFTSDAEALQGLSALAALVQPPERFELGEHAAYLWCANGILDSAAGKALLGKAGRAATSRNWATVQKLCALLAA